MKYIKVADDVYFTESDGEGVILDFKNDIFYGLDETGMVIFRLIIDNVNYEEIINKLLEIYDIQKTELEVFIKEFLEDLKSKGLVNIYD